MKLGVSRDTIKTTLTGAGWVAADVEDTLKKVESAKAAPAQPAATTPAVAAMPITATSAFAAKPATAAPQTIKVSDLISSAPATKPAAQPSGAAVLTSKSPLTGGPAASTFATMPAGIKTADTFQASSFVAAKPHKSHGALIMEIVLVVIILAIGGFAAFLFMQNNSLTTQLSSLNGQSSGVNSQLSALQAQVAASTTALTAQVSLLGSENQGLQTELSFLAAPAGTVVGATSTATISGTITAGKTLYTITTTHNVKIFIANSKAASVIAALAPLLATAGTPAVATSTATSTTATSTAAVAPTGPVTAQFTGTYIPGSGTITLTQVNGTSL